MTKLEKLYSIIENSNDVGIKLPQDVIKQVEELEEDIIKKEILPALSNDIAPRLDPIKRDLVLVVDYHPGTPISVSLSRKTNIAQLIGAKQIGNTQQPATNSHPQTRPNNWPYNPNAEIAVEFPDGTIFDDNKAIKTFVAVIEKVGFDKVAQIGIDIKGFNLVDTKERIDLGYSCQTRVGKYYVYSKLGNAQKVGYLNRISNYYNLGLIIEMK